MFSVFPNESNTLSFLIKKRSNRCLELPQDFWIPINLDTNNITLLSPFPGPSGSSWGQGRLLRHGRIYAFRFCDWHCHQRPHRRIGPSNARSSDLQAMLLTSFYWTNLLWLVNYKPLSNSVFKPDHALEVETYTRWPCDYLSRYIPEGLQCSCGPDWYTTNYTNNKYNSESYVMFLFCSCFAVPFATIIFCYAQLLITLKMAQAESSSTQKAEREVSRMVVVVVMGFLVCWTPYASFALWVVNNRGQQT
uniref:Opsin 1 (cone pigments), short-wave-sensitive 2 n=1 Tax=Scophthalmus maximus TaxID=52904 RepID=A0A8D3D6A8_SCOMX